MASETHDRLFRNLRALGKSGDEGVPEVVPSKVDSGRRACVLPSFLLFADRLAEREAMNVRFTGVAQQAD